MNEIRSAELMAAVIYSELKDYEIVVKIGNRYCIGKLSKISIEHSAGEHPAFRAEGIFDL